VACGWADVAGWRTPPEADPGAFSMAESPKDAGTLTGNHALELRVGFLKGKG
jgi:hypothetical protein